MSRPFIKCGFVGLAVIAMSIALLFVFPSKSNIVSMPEGFINPIVAFEFAETQADIELLFGDSDFLDRSKIIKAMDMGNKLDYIYMLLYSLFLGLFSLTCAKITKQKKFYAPAGLSVVVLVADATENFYLLKITSKLGTADIAGELYALHYMTWIKWGGLALIFMLLAPYFIKNGRYGIIIAATGIISFVLAVLSFFHRSAINEIFASFVAVMFILMIIYCFIHRRAMEKS